MNEEEMAIAEKILEALKEQEKVIKSFKASRERWNEKRELDKRFFSLKKKLVDPDNKQNLTLLIGVLNSISIIFLGLAVILK